MKKSRLITLLAGLALLAASVSVSAHDPRHYNDRRDGALSGGVTVRVDPYGRVTYGGTLGYTAGGGYAPGYSSWISHPHGPACGHGTVQLSDRAYRELERHQHRGKGYRGKGHGKKHVRKHHGRGH